jgi:hypothetical protein
MANCGTRYAENEEEVTMKLHVNDLFDCDDTLQDENNSETPAELAHVLTQPDSAFVSSTPDAGTVCCRINSAANLGTPSPKSMSLQQALERSARTSAMERGDRNCQHTRELSGEFLLLSVCQHVIKGSFVDDCALQHSTQDLDNEIDWQRGVALGDTAASQQT